MRKYFVTGFYLLIIGGLLLLGGVLMGANRSVVWDHGFKVAQEKDETYPLADFKNVYVEGKDVDVSIRFGDRYKIHIAGDKSQAPTYKVKDDTLSVVGPEKKGSIGVDVLGHEKITITIPMNKKLDNVHLRTAKSNLQLNDVTINNLVKTAQDMDYDSNIALNDVTIHNAADITVYNAAFNAKNSNITNLNLAGSEYSTIKTDNTTIKDSHLNLDGSTLAIKQSNLDSMNAVVNHGKVNLTNTVLMNKNKFDLSNSSKFTGSNLTVDGLKLALDKGLVRCYNRNYGIQYENKADAANLLDVKGTKGTITIK